MAEMEEAMAEASRGRIDEPPTEDRVLVLAPTERDAELSRSILAEAAITAVVSPNLEILCREMAAGCGAAVLTGEAVLRDHRGRLAEVVRAQPAWSDLPLIVLTGGGADSPAAAVALETLGNVTLLDRPVHVSTLVSTVRSALRARRKQYQVRDHLVERARVAEMLRDADRRKDEFLAMLGHELRNPLAPVQNAVQILRTPGIEASLAMGAVEMVERQVAHLARLVDDLLDVSRVSRGKVELRKELVDLGAVAIRSAEAMRAFLTERGHRLETALPPETLPLDADPARLEQVITNLLANAGKYTAPGGQIRLTVSREGNEGIVRVADNGIGIRPEALASLFELFVQADRVPGRVSEGLGLGLALVKLLVEMHGGRVMAASDGPGRGSEFTVRLPLAFAPAGRPTTRRDSAETARPAPRSLRVLVCDDNEDAADSLGTLLRLRGHQVNVCYNGPEALAAAEPFQPDVVLLDIGLPGGMDGYEVARRLQSDGARTATLVALTGFGQEDDRRRSSEAGFQAHLVKPVEPRVLEDLLRLVHDGKSAR
jgi:signal transduction histidine kinase/CheY-like chemotaxis protein